jgi:hypothetical protein
MRQNPCYLKGMETLEEALKAYSDNLDWYGNSAKARTCLVALKYIRMNRPLQSGHNSAQMAFEQINEEIKQLEAFVASATAQGKGRFVGMRSRWGK